MPEAVIVATGRTPIGRANKGSLVTCRPDDLTALVIKEVLAKLPGLDPNTVEDVIVGCGQPAGEAGYNVARVAALLAGLDVPGVTVNRYCSSSLQTIRMAAHAIRAGEGDVFVSAGVETVSRFQFGASDTGPHNTAFAEAEARTTARAPAVTEPWTPLKGLPDVYIAMGQTAENVAEAEHVTRQRMDEFAALSQNRAVESQGNGFFEREIIPVTLEDGTVVSKDDGPRPGTTVEGLSQLKPVFREGGTITAGNACPLNDGAAAVVVMSATRAAELGITPLARIVASGVSALDPEIMGLGPVEACRQTLKRAGMTIDDIDLVEINEAFAAQVIPSAEKLGIPWDKLNVKGGAIALGHPFGMTGARIMTTLLNALEDTDKTFGLESMCVGGGQGMAMIVERLRWSALPSDEGAVALRIGIVLFDGVEELDWVGPWEVLTSWARHFPDDGVEVFTLSPEGGLVTCAKGARVLADHSWVEHPPIDVLVYPGGQGTRRQIGDEAVRAWVREMAARAQLVTSVCTGALVLADAGLLDHRPATTHWASLDALAGLGVDIEVRGEDRFVDDGDVITAAGISAGIDMALHMVARLGSTERARDVRHFIQYDPQPPV